MESSNRLLPKRLLRGGVWALLGRVVGSAAALGATSLAAKMLVPADFGHLIVLSSLSVFGVQFFQFGIPQATMRCVSEDLATKGGLNLRRIVWRLLSLAAAMSILAVLVASVPGYLLYNSKHDLLATAIAALLVVWIVSGVVQQQIAETMRGLHDIRLAVILGGLMTSAVTLISLLAIQGAHAGLPGVLAVYSVSSVFVAVFGLWLLARRVPKESTNSGDSPAESIFKVAAPIWLSNVILIALSQADVWMISLYRPPAEVAVYGAVARLTALLATPLLVANAIAPPIIVASLSTGNSRNLEHVLRHLALLGFIAALLIYSFIAIFSRDVLGLLYGAHYESGVAVLLVLGAGQVFNVACGSCGQVLMLGGGHRQLLATTATSTAIALLGAALLAPKYGALGVASAMTTAITTQNVLMLLLVRAKFGILTIPFPLPKSRRYI